MNTQNTISMSRIPMSSCQPISIRPAGLMGRYRVDVDTTPAYLRDALSFFIDSLIKCGLTNMYGYDIFNIS